MAWPPTLAEDADALQGHLTDPDKPPTPTSEVRAPCCGRTCAADMVTDLRALAGTVIRPGGRGSGRDVPWACDACYRRIDASPLNGWKRSSLARALGAPDEALRIIRAQEMVREKRRTGAVVNPKEMMERKISDWEGQPAPVPGTEPPT